jgi:hypothetical protein
VVVPVLRPLNQSGRTGPDLHQRPAPVRESPGFPLAGAGPSPGVTALPRRLDTDRAMDIDLSVPIWTIEHVAAALRLSVDTAREYTYTPAFPAARAGFARHLWLREEVLAWFAALPAAEPRRAAAGTCSAPRCGPGRARGTWHLLLPTPTSVSIPDHSVRSQYPALGWAHSSCLLNRPSSPHAVWTNRWNGTSSADSPRAFRPLTK